MNIDDDGKETLGAIWNSRDDPVGVCYGDDILDPEKAKRVQKEWEDKAQSRQTELGFMIQPLPGDGKNTGDAD